MHNDDTLNALYELGDRLWWLECQEWLIMDWLMETSRDYFKDRRYIAARERADTLRVAQREASRMTRA